MLEVLPLPIESPISKEELYIHPSLPKGSCLIVAPTNSGKTVMMINLLIRRVYGYSFAYKTVHVFSPTIEQDASWDTVRAYKPRMRFPPRGPGSGEDGKRRRKMMTGEVVLHPYFDEGVVEDILDEQDGADADDRGRTLIILDDVADSLPHSSTILQRLAFRGRHSKTYAWLSVQKYRRVELGMRINFRFFIIFKVSATELRAIWEELSSEGKEEFYQLYQQATDKRYSFLTIDIQQPREKRYTTSFITQL